MIDGGHGWFEDSVGLNGVWYNMMHMLNEMVIMCMPCACMIYIFICQ